MVGKTTVSQKLSEKLNKKHINMDSMRETIYEEIGYSRELRKKLFKENGMWHEKGAYPYLQPFAFYAVKKILSTFSDCIFDFGAYLGHYEDETMFSEIKELFSNFRNVILYLPSADKQESIEMLTKIYTQYDENGNLMFHDPTGIRDSISDIGYYFNCGLANHTVYRYEKSAEEVADEIITIIK